MDLIGVLCGVLSQLVGNMERFMECFFHGNVTNECYHCEKTQT